MKRLADLFLFTALSCSLVQAEEFSPRPEPRREEPPRVAGPRLAERPHEGGLESFRSGSGGDGMEIMRLVEQSPEIREKLGLSADQKEKLAALRDRVREQLPALREKADQARKALREIEQKGEAKDEDVLKALDDSMGSDAELRRVGMKTRLEAKNILTMEQREKVSVMMRERRERMGRSAGESPRDGAFRPPEGGRPLPPPENAPPDGPPPPRRLPDSERAGPGGKI